ncbi:MAG: hypothetical protein OHK006_15310 [Thermodesulfovibrionales bacterium]
MKRSGMHLAVCARSLAVYLALSALACSAPAAAAGADSLTRDPHQAQVVLFLSGPLKPSNNITLTLTSVRVIAQDGASRELLSGAVVQNSLELAGRQVLLSERMVPENRYVMMKLAFSKASLKRTDYAADLSLEQQEIEVPVAIVAESGKSASVFLEWNADASLREGIAFLPAFRLVEKVRYPRTLLAYVVNEFSNNVYVINRQTDTVVETILVGKRPRDIAVSERKDRQRLYVANSFSNSISVIDPDRNIVEQEIPVRYGREPVALAVVQVAAGREMLFVANYGSNTVSSFDTGSFQELQRIDVGNGPTAVAVDPNVELLMTARFLGQDDKELIRRYRDTHVNIYVANRNSKTVSVLRINTLTGLCDDVTKLEADWEPVALSADPSRGKILVVNYAANTMSAINIPQVIRGNAAAAVTIVNNVGPGGTDVVADPGFDRLYFLRESGEIAVMRIFWDQVSFAKTVSPSMLGTVQTGKQPVSLVFDPDGRKIYVVNKGSETVTVVDRTTRTEEKVIPAGKGPSGIGVFQE